MQGKPACARQSSNQEVFSKVYKKCTGGKKVGVRRAHAPQSQQQPNQAYFNNDPSAGSPTETLLRLLLPLNDQV